MTEQHEYMETSQLFSLVEEQLGLGRKASFTVTGMSMWPFLCHGRDSVILRAPVSEEIKVGDIVLLKIPVYEKYLLHRVTKLRDGRVQTTGDNNCFRDGLFPISCIIGVVDSLERKGKAIPVTSRPYRVASSLWRVLYPIRPVLLKLLRLVSKCKNRLRRKQN